VEYLDDPVDITTIVRGEKGFLHAGEHAALFESFCSAGWERFVGSVVSTADLDTLSAEYADRCVNFVGGVGFTGNSLDGTDFPASAAAGTEFFVYGNNR
jgi:hypothetical protein